MGILWDTSFPTFLMLTVVIGGAAAYMTGRALAAHWRPIIQPVLYTLLSGGRGTVFSLRALRRRAPVIALLRG